MPNREEQIFMNKPKAVIVDYGMGNLFSIDRAIRYVGGEAVISGEPGIIASAERIILPGVGAFGEAMKVLEQKNITEAIRDFVSRGRPLLGICLGMQLLMNESTEFGNFRGIGLVKGKVIRFDDPELGKEPFKIPHIGWNRLDQPPGIESPWENTLMEELPHGTCLYFVHSYYAVPENPSTVLAETSYGNNVFCSVVRKDNVIGFQAHPERSGEAGLNIFKNFLFNS